MSVAELPRAGGPVRVGLCRDSAPGNSTREGGRGEQRRGSILLEVVFIFFSLLYKHVERRVLT